MAHCYILIAPEWNLSNTTSWSYTSVDYLRIQGVRNFIWITKKKDCYLENCTLTMIFLWNIILLWCQVDLQLLTCSLPIMSEGDKKPIMVTNNQVRFYLLFINIKKKNWFEKHFSLSMEDHCFVFFFCLFFFHLYKFPNFNDISLFQYFWDF